MARRRLTGFSRFVMAMLIIIPVAIVGSLWFNNEEITLDNITNPEKWTEKDKPKVKDEKKDIKIIPNNDVKNDESKPQDIKDLVENIKNKDEESTNQEDENQADKKRNLKDLLKDKLDKKDKGETTIKDNENVAPVSADVKALQARISRLEDDLAEKDARIEKLYQQKNSNNCKATRDSLRLIQGKLEDLKRALN